VRRGGGRGPGWARKEAGALGPEAGARAVPPAVEGSGGEGTCRRLGASTTRCRGGGRREGDASHGDGGGDWASGERERRRSGDGAVGGGAAARCGSP